MDTSRDCAPSGAPTDRLVQVGLRDNFYQTAGFIPMSFALVTSMNENGETGIGPHALCFPFSVTAPFSMLLISRGNSGTAINLRRTGRCALNYIEFDRDQLDAIAALGYPGQDAAAKRRANPFTLVPAPTGHHGRDPRAPQIVDEAFQVLECSWDRTAGIGEPRTPGVESQASRFVLNVDNLLLRERYLRGAQDGSRFPRMPIFFGFRANGAFWFAEHAEPFPVMPPVMPNTELQAVHYLATRLDETVRFTDDACAELARIPRPFLTDAMTQAIGAARDAGTTLIDAGFLRRMRDGSPHRPGH